MRSASELWTQKDGIALARMVEGVCPEFGCHVALTGGLLYKDGGRKDCDLLFYRIRQRDKIDMDGLWGALDKIGLVKGKGFGWVYKAQFMGRTVDCFFPEEQGGEYRPVKEDDPIVEELRRVFG